MVTSLGEGDVAWWGPDLSGTTGTTAQEADDGRRNHVAKVEAFGTRATRPSTTVTVARTATHQPYPAGTVMARDGSIMLRCVRLDVTDRGKRRVYLPRLSRGNHHLLVPSRPSDAASRTCYSTAVKVAVR